VHSECTKSIKDIIQHAQREAVSDRMFFSGTGSPAVYWKKDR